MARRLQPAPPSLPLPLPCVRYGLLAQDAALAAWMQGHLAVVLGAPARAEPTGPVLLAVHAHACALPGALTWAYSQLKRTAQQDAARPLSHRLLPRLHLVLVGVQDAVQAQRALANMGAAVQQHLGVSLPPGQWLGSAPPPGASVLDAPGRASLALDFCRLAAELRPWSAP
jgi:hypothetical protein